MRSAVRPKSFQTSGNFAFSTTGAFRTGNSPVTVRVGTAIVSAVTSVFPRAGRLIRLSPFVHVYCGAVVTAVERERHGLARSRAGDVDHRRFARASLLVPDIEAVLARRNIADGEVSVGIREAEIWRR